MLSRNAVSATSVAQIAEVLKRRGVREIAYFHTDHFEPYRSVPGRSPAFEAAIPDVETFATRSEELDFARNSTLFYKPNVAYVLAADRDLYRGHPADALGFCPSTPAEVELSRAFLQPLAAGGHDIQLHIHHEHYTYNTTGRDQANRDYLASPAARVHDAARVELAVKLSLDVLRQDSGRPLDRWFFVHGVWALNASDPHECTIVREIELLQRNGCLGDFTQPAGRVHVDSRIDLPHLVDPFPYAKGYDSAGARPSLAEGAGEEAARRFFIWASGIDHRLCSIDTYSKMVQRRVREPETFAMGQASESVVIDGILYVKTHAHSMAPAYWQPKGGIPFPHIDPGVRRELGLLFDAAEAAAIKVSFPTVTEVYDRIVGAPATPHRDLATEARLFSAPPTATLGVTVVFRDEAGAVMPPPPLAPWSSTWSEPAVADPSAALHSPVIASEVVDVVVLGSRPEEGDRQGDLLAAPDVQMVDKIASAIALQRQAAMGEAGSGVSGFYAARSAEGALLQRAEVACVDLVAERFPGVRKVYEIGSGLGVMTTLLAVRGFNAVGVEQNAARHATSIAIAEAVTLRNPHIKGTVNFVHGAYPNKPAWDRAAGGGVALLTNLLGSAPDEKQTAIIEALAGFKAVVVDMQRFYDRRTSIEEIDALARRFRKAGFGAPEQAFDLGDDGRYFLFESTVTGQPALRILRAAKRAGKRALGAVRRRTKTRA